MNLNYTENPYRENPYRENPYRENPTSTSFSLFGIFCVVFIGLFVCLVLFVSFHKPYSKNKAQKFGVRNSSKIRAQKIRRFLLGLLLLPVLLCALLWLYYESEYHTNESIRYEYNRHFRRLETLARYPYKEKKLELGRSLNRYFLNAFFFIDVYNIYLSANYDFKTSDKLMQKFKEGVVSCARRLQCIAQDVRNRLLKYDQKYKVQTYLNFSPSAIEKENLPTDQYIETYDINAYYEKKGCAQVYISFEPRPPSGQSSGQRSTSVCLRPMLRAYYPDMLYDLTKDTTATKSSREKFVQQPIMESQVHYVVYFCENMARLTNLIPHLTELSQEQKEGMLNKIPSWVCNWEFASVSRLLFKSPR